jgi:glycosyltransferase involved in cell wall biosynthesis
MSEEIMKKICHITSAHKSTDSRIFFKECISLEKAGYKVFIIAKGDSEVKNNIQIVGVEGSASSRLLRILKISNAVYKKALEIEADIYHIHDPELLPYALKLKSAGKKVVFDSHEDIPEQVMEKTWIPTPFRSGISYLVKKYQNYVCQKIDAIISVTPHICYKLRLVNPNTYMITNYPVLNENASPVFFEKENTRTICFAGGISEQWSHENILYAINDIGDVNYDLCGFGDKNYLESLKSNSAWSKVNYRGKVSHEDVSNVLSSCNVGMALLKKGRNTGGELGTLGNTKLFEYMMAGIPVICTNFTLWKEIIDQYNCGICVDPNDIEEITTAINYLLENPNIAIEMGKNGRKAVNEKYNWMGEEIKLLDLYRSL